MSLVVLPLAALGAGIISFTSPCCLPLIPGYLSYMSALPVSQLERDRARSATLRAALLFVAGFTLVFTILGVSFAVVGSLLTRNLPFIIRLAGVGIVIMGLAMTGLLRIPLLYRERRVDLARIPRGPRAAFGLGMAFAAGWVPCIGPILATILTAAAATSTVTWGALLLVIYSIGLGLPFIVVAVGLNRARGSIDWLRRNSRTIEIVGGLLLVVVGVLFISGAWRTFFLPLQREFAQLGWPPV